MLRYGMDLDHGAPTRGQREIKTESELGALVLARLRNEPDARNIWKVAIVTTPDGSWTWKYVGVESQSRAYLPYLESIIRELRSRYDCRPDISAKIGHEVSC